MKTLNSYAAVRPVDPYYPEVASTDLYPLLSAVYSSPDATAPARALAAADLATRREATGALQP